MTLEQSRRRARELLATHHIEEAALESDLLLMHTLKIGRVQLYQDLNRELSPFDELTYRSLIQRRIEGEPTAYITRHVEFYGLEFCVDPHVLIPRPESEMLVEKTLALAQDRPALTVADIGTGSGAVAISVAVKLPRAKICATDVSPEALEVARTNCGKHGVAGSITLLQSDLLERLPEPVDIIIANLPYVKQSDLSGLKAEPRLALDGGADGLDKIKRLLAQVSASLRPGGTLLLEIGQGQSQAVTAQIRRLFPAGVITVYPDLSGIERVVSLTIPPSG